MKNVNFFSIVVMFLLASYQLALSADLPRFFGVYVLENGSYVEVPRVDQLDKVKFNFLRRGQFGATDCNVKYSIKADLFVKASARTFNKEGFLVIQDESWSDFRLFRVPNTGEFIDNEKGTNIVTSIGYGCGFLGMIHSYDGLKKKVKPTEISLKKAKVGENAFICVPATSLEKGFYLIDYKKNLEAFVGWNPVRLY